MRKQFLFIASILLFFISVPFRVSADNTIIQKETIRDAVVTSGDRLTFPKGGKLWLAGGKSYGATIIFLK
ncbi:MAG: hypothetical protein IJW31_02325 [Lentisphaeria bacterium]|nr:hypothetical protein [Lentisphaeria bacterium]